MAKGWFLCEKKNYNSFVLALLAGDVESMNVYMNQVALHTFSSFDVGSRLGGEEPERFYHGFVLGLIVELKGRYAVTSNRESGFGRYDVLLEPLTPGDHAMVLEFKVYDSKKEAGLEATVDAAMKQILNKRYTAALEAKGIPKDKIRIYGFAFRGKEVLIGGGDSQN